MFYFKFSFSLLGDPIFQSFKITQITYFNLGFALPLFIKHISSHMYYIGYTDLDFLHSVLWFGMLTFLSFMITSFYFPGSNVIFHSFPNNCVCDMQYCEFYVIYLSICTVFCSY